MMNQSEIYYRIALIFFYSTLTTNIYMTILSYKACTVSNVRLICTIVCDIQELNLVTGFKDLIRKIIEAKFSSNLVSII